MKSFNLIFSTLITLIVFLFSSVLFAQDTTQTQTQTKTKNKGEVTKQVKAQKGDLNRLQHGRQFVDEDGDGFNDNAPDHDGDGIPNGQDPDYDGAKLRAGKGNKGFIDSNGDGINDNAEDWDGDGIPNGQDPDFERPMDGSGKKMQKGNTNRNRVGKNGFGPQNKAKNCTGNSDGTGQKNAKKKGKNQ